MLLLLLMIFYATSFKFVWNERFACVDGNYDDANVSAMWIVWLKMYVCSECATIPEHVWNVTGFVLCIAREHRGMLATLTELYESVG